MAVRLLQLSDLHAGVSDPSSDDLERALRSLVERHRPELVIASGDLTHRNRRSDHERAATLLRSLGTPVLVIPGNHDIPALPPRRFIATFAEFEWVWGETEPVYRSERLVACGLNSVRPWLYQEGALRSRQLERAARILADAPSGALRVVALHHHLVSALWRTAKRPVARRSRVLSALAEAGAELVVSGHVHQSAVAERREFDVATGVAVAMTIVTAPGLGRPRPSRRGEARGLHLYEADELSLRVLTYTWTGEGFELIAERRFPRGIGELSVN